ncbi:serrate RNA effector molecule, partial [Tanacetum coccineum]
IGECFLDLQSWPCDLSCSTLLQILPLGLSVCALGLPRWHDDVDRSGSDSDCVQNPQGNLLYARTEYSNGNNDSSEGRGCGSYSRGRRRCRGQGRGRDNSQNQGQRDSSKNCEDNKQKGKQHEKRDLLHIQCYRCDHYGHFVSKCPERNRYHKVNLNKTQEKEKYTLPKSESNTDDEDDVWYIDNGASNRMTDKEANQHQVTIHNPVLETSPKSKEDKSGSDDMSIPIARLQTIRLLIALAAGRGWKIHHFDVKTAFLNGDRKKLDSTLKEMGFLQCVHEKAVYRKVPNGEFIIVVINVDDIFVTGTSLDLINWFKRRMASHFEMSDLEAGMEDCIATLCPMESGLKLSKAKDEPQVEATQYQKMFMAATVAACQAIWLRKVLVEVMDNEQIAGKCPLSVLQSWTDFRLFSDSKFQRKMVNVKLEWSGRALLVAFEFCCNRLQQYVNPTYVDKFGYDHPGGYERDMGGYHDDRPRGRFAGRSSGGYQGGPGSVERLGGWSRSSSSGHHQKRGWPLSLQDLIRSWSLVCLCLVLQSDSRLSEAFSLHSVGYLWFIDRTLRVTQVIVQPLESLDWESGRNGYNGHANMNREGVMSYKQFIQELEDDVLPSEAERRYQEYKSELRNGLKDKYHPTNLLSVIERRNEVARKLAKEFLLDLEDDSLTSLLLEPEGLVLLLHLLRSQDRPVLLIPKMNQIWRIQTDVVQAQALVKKLDLEKGIDDNMLSRADNDRSHRDKSHSSSSGPVVIIRGSNAVKGLEGVELLDTLITYLWRIHGVDYYGMTEKSEAKGVRHVRAESKSSDAKTSGVEWEDKLDSHWQDRLKGLDPLEIMTAKEKIDAAAAESLDPYVRKIQDEKYGWKYGCGAKGCTKLFHAAEFVHKHLKLKHPELSMEKERPQRHRPGIGDRLKDDRDLRRDRNNGGDRFDKGENLDSSEFQSNNDDGGHDDQMFDSFSGQGVHAQFPSDVPPPPVLMPVPGAGPLGPFIPAPPEVAMRMMRDIRAGLPSPFEGAGRNVLARLQMTAPAPMIALPPSFRQDPRRLRRQVHQDLDAPEDEVTVID